MKRNLNVSGQIMRVALPALLVFASLVIALAGAAPAGLQAFTLIPTWTINPSFTLLDPSLWPVNIPDANLNAALHTACGKPLADPLLRGDLAALTGPLVISNKNIANLEGVQFCTQITRLDASSNPLAGFPDLNGMTGLQQLYLTNANLTQVPPQVATAPNLSVLNLSENQITDVSGLNGCAKLQILSLRVNKIAALPGTLDLPLLYDLDLSANRLDVFPAVIFSLTKLVNLYLNDNKLAELPDNLAAMPKLKSFTAYNNVIRAIPAALGTSKIEFLNLSRNVITTLPDALFQSTHLTSLEVSLNRISRVPDALKQINYSILNLNFNYIDIAPGSASRTILEAVTASIIDYDLQLTPIKDLIATPTDTSVELSWSACPDLVTATCTASVVNYIVYLNQSGTLTSLATLGRDVPAYVDTGLAAGSERKYTIAVVYEIAAPCLDATSRHYTSVTTTTLVPTVPPTPTPEPTETSQATEATESTPATSESTAIMTSAEPSGTDEPNQPRPTVPTWPFLLIGGVAIGGLAAAGAIWLILNKKGRPQA